MGAHVLGVHQHGLVLAIKHENLMNYSVSFLVVSGSLSSRCHLASYDGKSPPHNLDEAGESFDLFLQVDEDFLVGAVFGLKRVEELLEVLDGQGCVAVELPIQNDGDDSSEGPDGFIAEAYLHDPLDIFLSDSIHTSRSFSLFSRKGKSSNKICRLSTWLYIFIHC